MFTKITICEGGHSRQLPSKQAFGDTLAHLICISTLLSPEDLNLNKFHGLF